MFLEMMPAMDRLDKLDYRRQRPLETLCVHARTQKPMKPQAFSDVVVTALGEG